ncbi:beta-ketoacyl-[acyl-carrier-protein] synthase family protein [Streptomyces acidiscabies]|uniref:Beta-ketoacyl-[acyl-carrier-protein] synthase family protein n=1 Tax=Streptomyces acidiscabies TaxID=42234 RepID=A0AAP6B6P4_9ACTN|nr:beta-ketoacyl-[acyl-carrier-protein] synthase family protein [Streptomyces acidiscabies]MBP5939992.1 beta-ketoacyl-[acyl-carrier-protein] synthase family protein [Streptomyces sp. LBUM 1476]MBZ3911183.1 beta-ketoacyl-[acyl-carrier-protein] synthase family protein [Streptomyces acidiscabies]MDX2959035.1 beta-ketoacyl-[acyl-carrier-protein] synthase family protein [Streptomyces acidiscabies]MDX3023883.1 beta-ketoacyl-[acyl-carrier-protein] synthase family protein [Streptomyces acidiscabies]MD
MTDHEVVITGMGVVTPNAGSVESFWEANLTGRSGLSYEKRMDLSDLPCGWVAGIIPDDIKKSVEERAGAPGRTWVDTLLHATVDEALQDAGVEGPLDRPAGLMWSRIWPGPSGSFPDDYLAYMKNIATRYKAVGNDRRAALDRMRGEESMVRISDLSAFPTELSRRLGAPLIPMGLEATCAGGLRAVAEAARLLRTGRVGLVVVAACVSRNTQYVLSQYGQLMALSRWKGPAEQASMPFDRRRTGMVINESAGALVLETAEHARARGVETVHAVVGGWGTAVDITHVTAPRIDVVERVVRDALKNSELTPDDIDTINAHGTSTRLNDITEARALHRVFGERMAEIDVSAVKSLTGHGSAASGVVESVVAALTLCRGVIPPVVTCTEPDPKCGVKTSLTPVERPVRTVLKNSFGFGGQYASMVFHRPAAPRL